MRRGTDEADLVQDSIDGAMHTINDFINDDGLSLQQALEVAQGLIGELEIIAEALRADLKRKK